MRLVNLFADLPIAELFDTLLPDFLLAFTFFTALMYAVLGKRFGHQRPAAIMFGTLGLALASGLVWWEHEQGWSIRDLGPVALGFAIIILGMVMYQAIRKVGGSWAGAGIALGGSLFVAWMMGFDWPVAKGIIQSIMVVGLIVGILGFMIHGRDAHGYFSPSAKRKGQARDVRHDMTDLYRSRRVGKGVRRGLRRLRREAVQLPEHPKQGTDVMQQLSRMLPVEGWLTEQLARLRTRAHAIRKGEMAKIDELQHVMAKLPREARTKAKLELVARYKKLQLDTRFERLEKVVAENERRITLLTQEARNALARHDYRKLTDLLKAAEILQKHNSSLMRIIDRTEQKVARIAEHVAKEASVRQAA